MRHGIFGRSGPGAGALAAFVVVLAGGAGECAAQCQPGGDLPPIPTMTVKILNNSQQGNLYPVLSVGGGVPGAGVTDTWMQAWFRTKPQSCLGINTYPRSHIYRMYIAASGTGIPVGGSATITLPLYMQLAKTIDPTKGDQLVDWWQGGGVRMFYSLKALGKPPAALVRDLMGKPVQPMQKPVTPAAGAMVPSCVTDTGATCSLSMFEDTAELPLGDPYQLEEYTLGAVDSSKVPYTLNTTNVDIDVSYVDSAFMPMMVEPYPNTHGIYGWIGMDGDVGNFSGTVQRFVNDFKGWPQFLDNRKTPILKVPSAINILVANEPNQSLDKPARTDLTPYDPKDPTSWAPIVSMQKNWQKQGSSELQQVAALLAANYANYSRLYTDPNNGWGCDTNGFPEPIANTLFQTLGHVYGWTPFVTHCAPSANQLYNTPGYYKPGPPPDTKGYQVVKNVFDELQYNYKTETDKTRVFDPYVDLIHGANYLNAQYAYAFSVDDGVGNLQVDGATGFYIAVGTGAGMPNTEPLGQLVNVTFGPRGPKDTVWFTKFGVCTSNPDTVVNPSYTTVVVSSLKLTSCPMVLKDNTGSLYYFGVKKAPDPDYPVQPKNVSGPGFVDCSKNTDAHILGWCNAIFGTLIVDPSNGNTQNAVISGAPFQPPT
jgi:hypothetical protein